MSARFRVEASCSLDDAGTGVRLDLFARRRVPKRQRAAAAANEAAAGSATVCYDLGSFAGLMSEAELGALANQLAQSYGFNRALATPFQLHFAGLDAAAAEEAAGAHGVLRALARHSYENWRVARQPGAPWEVPEYAGRDVVYLSADADEPLAGPLGAGTVLVIGGLVDYTQKPGAARRVADAGGVRAARLPLDAYCTVRKPSLTCLAVLQILAGYAATNDWGRAVREAPAMSCAPLRKYVRWLEPQGEPQVPAPAGAPERDVEMADA